MEEGVTLRKWFLEQHLTSLDNDCTVGFLCLTIPQTNEGSFKARYIFLINFFNMQGLGQVYVYPCVEEAYCRKISSTLCL